MKLEGIRLYLRPLMPSDAEGAYPNWLNDPEVCRYNSHGETLYTTQMAYDYIQYVSADPSYAVFAVCMNKDNRHIGNISLQQISSRNRNAELAILLGEHEAYGKGIGYEASRLLLDYAFGSLELHRVHCGTHHENTGMRRLAEKLGMTEEGYRREALFKNGKFADIVEYGILHYEYRTKF